MRKQWMKKTAFASVAVVAALVAACGQGTELEVRTFRVDHIGPGQVTGLIEPYVYVDREGARGTMAVSDGAVTVRETPDNLERISRVLAEFDVPQRDTRLHFQLIEADGFTETDPSIAAVEAELRKIFQFEGYRLAGDAYVAATDGSEVQQGLRGPDGTYQITGEIYRMTPGLIRLQEMRLWDLDGVPTLQTSMNIRPGQTIILGSTPKEGSSATLLLTVRAQEVEGPA